MRRQAGLKWCLLMVVFFVLACAACSSEPVSVDDVTGRWALSAEVRQRLQISAARAELTINRDGTFQAVQVPADLLYVESGPLRTSSGSGRWRVADESGRDVLKLQFLEVEGSRRSPYSVSLYVTRRGEAANLDYFSGDPDEGNVVSFSRQ
jgi:hypothetical protein